MKRVLALGGFLLGLCFFPAAFSRDIVLKEIIAEKNNSALYVYLPLSGDTAYRSFVLSHPTRFVMDLRNTTASRSLHLSAAAKGFIEDFRYATHPQKKQLRLVFQLVPSVMATVSAARSHQSSLQIIFAKKNNITAATKTTQPVKNFAIPPARHEIIVVIDPGHGGKDPGAIGRRGAKEKNIVLEISKALARAINAQPGFRAVLTRDNDRYLSLRQRLAIARRDHADMFVAIHADKWRNSSARGVSVFALSQRGATSEAARWLANRENASELIGGVKLDDQSHLLKSVLLDLSQSATIRTSLEIGHNIIRSVSSVAHLHHRSVEQAAFVVLKSPDIPSLLVETGFLSNLDEEKRLTSKTYQNEIATAIMKGVCGYYKKRTQL